VTATRCLPLLLAGMTMVVLFANARPAAKKKHRLEREHRALVDRYRENARREAELAATTEALREDPFVVERTCAEVWAARPSGALTFGEVLDGRMRLED